MSMLDAGSAWLSGQLQQYAANPATYRRGGATGTSCPILATSAKTPTEATSEEGVTVVGMVRDFIVPAASIVLSGIQTKPESGDEIVVTGTGSVYQVMPIAPGGREWEWSDAGDETTYRIHTKQVFAE